MNAFTSFVLGLFVGWGTMGAVWWACHPRVISPQQKRRWRDRDEHSDPDHLGTGAS